MDAAQGYILRRMDEMRDILKDCSAKLDRVLEAPPQAPPAPVMIQQAVAPLSRAQRVLNGLRWLLSTDSIVWLLRTVTKHSAAIGTVLYMLATGQHAKVLAYVNGLLGI